MKSILTSSQMKQCDYNTINYFCIPSLVLMERASESFVSVLTDYIDFDSRVLVFVGSGNNGGDGVCCARLLHNYGYNAALLLCGDKDKYSPDLNKQLEIAAKYNIEIASVTDIDNYDVLVDAIFGIGLSRDITGTYADYIKAFNDAECYKAAIDIPSGINSDTGCVMGVACNVDITVTFNYKKPGHLLYPGREYCGYTYIRDIGINDNSFLDDITPGIFNFENVDLHLLDNRKSDSNKGDFGKVLIIAGQKDMSGAAYLSAKAALRMGAGLVKVYTFLDNGPILQRQLPECLISTYDSYDEEKLSKELNWSNVCVIGPGIGQSDDATSMTRYVLDNYEKPLIIDADAINIISKDLSMLNCNNHNRIITPHLGEMRRLIQIDISQIKEDMIKVASDFANSHEIITVLKAASTVTSTLDGKSYINTSGNNGMSTAGSGDVLTGIIAGLIANNIDCDIAAGLGVYIHGLCGDEAALNTNEHYLMASDIIDSIRNVIRGL
ncbi:MAG: NAD(P)H-hydrate dehydratase [Lachnospiraceae bacterium]|nr:NAD(P)H-hydrate dehydratase [Lachnospiraceae bacterium]